MMKKWLLLPIFVLALARPALASDNEFIVGGGAAANNLCQYAFGFAEDVYWFDGKLSPGIGAYGALESGVSKLSAYGWDGNRVGPQIGLKRYRKVDSGKTRDLGGGWQEAILDESQWQVKLRYVWETQEGDNSESGYRMKQENTLLGVYAEHVRQLDADWRGIFIVEGWKTLTKERSSTWNGDAPEGRDTLNGWMMLQRRIRGPLSARAGASLFWQEWDDMAGYRFQAEARLYGRFMFGAYVAAPFTVPEAYKENNAEVADLTTVGFFGRVEF